MSYLFDADDPPRNPAAAPALFLRNATLPMLTQFVDVDNEPASALNSPDVHRAPGNESLNHLQFVYHLTDSAFSASEFVAYYFDNAPPVKLSDWARLPSKGFKSLKDRTRSIVPDNVPEISMRLLEGLCTQTQGLIHATGEYMDHCFLPQSQALPTCELEVMEAYEGHSPCNMETLFWGRKNPISGNLEPKMAVVVLAPWTFKSGHLVEFQHGASDEWGVPFTAPESGISCALWEKLLRTCVQLGIHYWVVTNYNEFIFGSFSKWMTTVFLTETLKCDRGDPSISEAMFFWTMSSANAAGSFEIPSVLTELKPIPNPAHRNWAILRGSITSSNKRRLGNSGDDADSSDPPVIAPSILPLYKTPAPTTKKRKLSAPTVVQKENAVGSSSASRRRTTSLRAPTLVQSNLPNLSKLRLMGSALTKQSSFGMSNQANPLYLLHTIPTTDEKEHRAPAPASAPAPVPVPVPVPVLAKPKQEMSPQSAAERARVNMALAVIAPRPPPALSPSLASSRASLARRRAATPHPNQTMKSRSPIQSPPQRPLPYHRPSHLTSAPQSRPAVSFAPPSADQLSFPHHLRSKSVPIAAVPPSASPLTKKARFSAGTTPADPKSSLLNPYGSLDESVPSDDERMPTQLDHVQAWNSAVHDTAMSPPSVKWNAATMDLASPAPYTAESPAATNPFDKLTDAQVADRSDRNALQSNPALGKIWQPVWDASTWTGNKQHHHTIRERQVGIFARMRNADPTATRQQALDLSKRIQEAGGETGAKREFGGPWLFAPKNVHEGQKVPDWDERPRVAPRFAGSREEVWGFEMGLFAPSPAGVSQLESPAPTPQSVDLDQAFEMEMESSVRDIVRRETKMKYQAQPQVGTSQDVASPSSSQNSELAFQPIPRSIDGVGDYAIQATIYGKEFFLNEEGSIIDPGNFMEFEGEFSASSQDTSSAHEGERDGDGDSEMSPSQEEAKISTSRRSEASSADAEGSTDSEMDPIGAPITPVRPQSVRPFYDAYVAEDYPTPTSAHGMQEPVRLHSSGAAAVPCDPATPQYHCPTPGGTPQDPLAEALHSPPWEHFYSYPDPYYHPDHTPSVPITPNLGHTHNASIPRATSSANHLPSPITAPTPPLVGIPTRTPPRSFPYNVSGTWNLDSLQPTTSAFCHVASFTAPWAFEDSNAAAVNGNSNKPLFEFEDNA